MPLALTSPATVMPVWICRRVVLCREEQAVESPQKRSEFWSDVFGMSRSTSPAAISLYVSIPLICLCKPPEGGWPTRPYGLSAAADESPKSDTVRARRRQAGASKTRSATPLRSARSSARQTTTQADRGSISPSPVAPAPRLSSCGTTGSSKEGAPS